MGFGGILTPTPYQGSECFAYGSAVVDPVRQRAWVFGSERDLCGGRNHSSSTACAPFWQQRGAAGVVVVGSQATLEKANAALPTHKQLDVVPAFSGK